MNFTKTPISPYIPLLKNAEEYKKEFNIKTIECESCIVGMICNEMCLPVAQKIIKIMYGVYE